MAQTPEWLPDDKARRWRRRRLLRSLITLALVLGVSSIWTVTQLRGNIGVMADAKRDGADTLIALVAAENEYHATHHRYTDRIDRLFTRDPKLRRAWDTWGEHAEVDVSGVAGKRSYEWELRALPEYRQVVPGFRAKSPYLRVQFRVVRGKIVRCRSTDWDIYPYPHATSAKDWPLACTRLRAALGKR